MPHIITDDCIVCGSCRNECPVDAISEGEEKYTIDAFFCMDCGACAEQCPVNAIILVQEK
ncbi:MAG: 4Fe-4S binding protein [Syntrophorhabdaceae bacterium]|jgi:ferredoxin|nr:4Fe-4S binding protein [Syntrophorhabdaceae bacterium]